MSKSPAKGGEGRCSFGGEGEAVSWSLEHQRKLRGKLHFISLPGAAGPHLASARAAKDVACKHRHVTCDQYGGGGCGSRQAGLSRHHLAWDSELPAHLSASEVASWRAVQDWNHSVLQKLWSPLKESPNLGGKERTCGRAVF